MKELTPKDVEMLRRWHISADADEQHLYDQMAVDNQCLLEDVRRQKLETRYWQYAAFAASGIALGFLLLALMISVGELLP